jgi:hypothetical protein
MKEFAEVSCSPETVQIMAAALHGAVDTLPEPVSLYISQRLAETILRLAQDGERDAAVPQRLVLLELQIGPER